MVRSMGERRGKEKERKGMGKGIRVILRRQWGMERDRRREGRKRNGRKRKVQGGEGGGLHHTKIILNISFSIFNETFRERWNKVTTDIASHYFFFFRFLHGIASSGIPGLQNSRENKYTSTVIIEEWTPARDEITIDSDDYECTMGGPERFN